MYTVDILESGDELLSFRDEWQELLNDSDSHEFHHHPDNIHLLISHLRKEMQPRIFFIRKNNILQCIAPFSLMQDEFRLGIGTVTLLKLPVQEYKLHGTRIIFSRKADLQGCLKALADELKRRQKEFNLIYLESLSHDSPFYTLDDPLPGFTVYPESSKKNVVRGLRTKNNFAEYLATFRKKRRYNLKRNLRLIEEAANGNLYMEKIEKPDQVEGFFKAVDQIYEKCWQRRIYGTYHHYSKGNIAYHKGIANLGWLRSYLLYCDGEPVAYIIGYQYQNRYYYEYIGYDRTWGKLSPGTVLTYLMIEDLHSHNRPEILDFGYGENIYKQIFGNFSYEATNTYIVPKLSRIRLAAQGQLTLSRLYFLLFSLLTKTGLDQKIRRRLRQR